MGRIEKWEQSKSAALLAALLCNALFLLVTVLLVRVGFESNDDLTLAAFVDGQMAQSTAHIPYINIALGALLKGIYDLLGRGVAWHSIGQYLLLFTSFTAMGAAFNRRLGLRLGTLAMLLLLLFFGADAYTVINYTKTAAVCTAGGMLLLVLYLEASDTRSILPGAVLGGVLCLFGFLLRDMEALPCLAILAGLCLRWAWGELFGTQGGLGGKLARLLRRALPLLLLVLLMGGFRLLDRAAWSSERWAPYASFDAVRVAYSDYGRPAWAEMPEEYEALGLTETDAKLLEQGNYFDPEAYSQDLMQAISAARDARFPHPSFGECLGKFLDTCLRGFFRNLPVYGLLLMLGLWLALGKRKARDWLCLAWAAGLFLLCYLYLIWRGRYLIDRVDLGLFLAVAVSLAWMLEPQRLRQERSLCLALLALALVSSFFLTRGSFRGAEKEDFSAERAAVERLLADREHVYFAKLDTVSDRIYSPFEPADAGYWDRIVLLGGFDCNHPTIMDNLRLYGVDNPYRDCVDNPRVYFIEDDVDLTLAHIRERYEPAAEAELVEPLSAETGLAIYRIVKGGGT